MNKGNILTVIYEFKQPRKDAKLVDHKLMRHGQPFVEMQDNLVRLAALKNDSYMMNPTWKTLSNKLPKKDVRPENYNEFTK